MLEALKVSMKSKELTWALREPGVSPPSGCRCHRCSRWRGGYAGRRCGPSWCGRPSRPRWPACGAAPRAAPLPPAGVGAAARSWVALWPWAAWLDRGSTARRWQTSRTRPRHTSDAQEFSGRAAVGSGQRKDTTLLALSWCILISEISEFVTFPPAPHHGHRAVQPGNRSVS